MATGRTCYRVADHLVESFGKWSRWELSRSHGVIMRLEIVSMSSRNLECVMTKVFLYFDGMKKVKMKRARCSLVISRDEMFVLWSTFSARTELLSLMRLGESNHGHRCCEWSESCEDWGARQRAN